jgi:2-haloacid dehalogenase
VIVEPYTTVLFDLDHTLLDSDTSEALAFELALHTIGVEDPAEHFAEYDRINRALWAAVERHELMPGQVRTTRFEQLIAAAGLDADPRALADTFAAGLGCHGELYPGALEMLDALAARSSLALVTNGLADVQRARIERLGIAQYFDAVVISAEIGASKPSTGIFDIAFDRLGSPAKGDALMVGDSLSSDIQGGVNYGIATCWYNPRRRAPDVALCFEHEIVALADLPHVVQTRTDAHHRHQ